MDIKAKFPFHSDYKLQYHGIKLKEYAGDSEYAVDKTPEEKEKQSKATTDDSPDRDKDFNKEKFPKKSKIEINPEEKASIGINQI